MKPSESEPVCLISFEIARTRLGGGPDSRPSFWKVYREEQELNRRTRFQNEHVRICRPVLAPLMPQLKNTFYFRKDRLVVEKKTQVPTE